MTRILACLTILVTTLSGHAAELKVLLPLKRMAYQTNERIDLAVVRSAKEALAAGTLRLNVNGTDDSRLAFAFPVDKADAGRAVEHLHVNGWLLRPGKYTIDFAYWGGTIAIVDASGAVQAQRRLPQDVTAMTWAGQQLIVGDADGRVTALTVR